MTLIEEEEIAVMVKKTLADALPLSNTPGPVDVTGEGGVAALSLLYIDARGDLFIKEQQNQPLVWDGTDVTIGATNSEYVKISGTGLQFFNGTIERFRIDIPSNDLIFYGDAGEAFFSVQQEDATGDPFINLDATALASDGDAHMSLQSNLDTIFTLSADEDNNNTGDAKITFRIGGASGGAKAGIYVDASESDVFKIESNQSRIELSNAAKRIDLENTDIFSIADQASKVAPGANHSGLTSINGELYAVDAGGTETIIIPHEVGEWTPTIEQSSVAFDGGYTYQFGDYVKIGSLVQASCWIRVAGSSGGSGTVSITGLPFAQNENQYQQVGPVGYNDGLSAALCTRGWVDGSKFTIIDSGITGSNYSGAVGGGELCFTVIYTTDG
jgi:hypothetical protein